MEEKKWYIRRNEKKEGPFLESELIRLIEEEIISKDDEIWTYALTRWIRLEDSVYCFYMPGVREADLQEMKHVDLTILKSKESEPNREEAEEHRH